MRRLLNLELLFSRMVSRTFATTLATAFVTLSVLSLLLASLIQIRLNVQSQQEVAAAEQELIAVQAADEVAHFMERAFFILETAGLVGRPMSAGFSHQRAVLESILGLEAAFREVALLDEWGKEQVKLNRLSVVTADDFVNWADSELFQTVSQGERYISAVYIDPLTTEPMVTMATPVQDTFNTFRGAFLIQVNLRFMWDFVGGLEAGKNGVVYVVDREGTLIAFEDLLRVLQGENVGHLHEVQEFLESEEDEEDETEADISVGINDTYILGTYVPLEEPDWAVIVELPVIEAYEGVLVNLLFSVGGAIFVSLLAGVVGVYLSRRLAAPVLKLTETTTHIANGHWEQEAPVEGTAELQRLARAFNRMVESIRKAERLKDEFLANTSHELRTPLNGIIGLAESLIDGATGPLPESTIYNLSMIVSSGRRLANLVNDILDFSKLKNDELILQLKPLDMKGLADVVLALSQPLIGSKGLELINQIDPLSPLVFADENRVQQILHNLVGNAIKFTSSGRVVISAQVEGGYLSIGVTDTGTGVSPEHMERIFVSFQQGDGSIARQYRGTGLGLSVTRQLVRLHGGEIGVESTVGEGSCFSFTLPLASEEKIAEALTVVEGAERSLQDSQVIAAPLVMSAPQALASASHEGKERILIVDDEVINLQVLRNHLSLKHYQVVQANSGAEALAILEEEKRIDLVLLDVMMPQMSGYEVCQELRKQWSPHELPVVLLTAKSQVSDLVTGFHYGANDYLTKPFAKDELLARIETHLNLKSLATKTMRLEAELDVLRRLQEMLLPTREELSQVKDLDIAGFMEPADEVGGDYYDVLQQNGVVKIGIGDVTGHGLESGMLMLMTQMGIRTLLTNQEQEPARFLNTLNRTIYDNLQRMQADKSLTLTLLDYHFDGSLRISGQHEEVIVVRHGGEIELIDTLDLGFPIGLDREISELIDSTSIQLQSGDGVVLYTDGITEAENIQGQQYGLERLCALLSEHWTYDEAETIKKAVIDDLRRYIGTQQVYDDITLVVVKRR